MTKMPTIIINIQSYINVITNSSTEIFVTSNSNVKLLGDFINSILECAGYKEGYESLFTIHERPLDWYYRDIDVITELAAHSTYRVDDIKMMTTSEIQSLVDDFISKLSLYDSEIDFIEEVADVSMVKTQYYVIPKPGVKKTDLLNEVMSQLTKIFSYHEIYN